MVSGFCLLEVLSPQPRRVDVTVSASGKDMSVGMLIANSVEAGKSEDGLPPTPEPDKRRNTSKYHPTIQIPTFWSLLSCKSGITWDPF